MCLSNGAAVFDSVMKNCFLHGDEDQLDASCVEDICDAVIADRSAVTTVGRAARLLRVHI
jgi:hypothetical protein